MLFSFLKRLQKGIWKCCLFKSSAAHICNIIDQYYCRGKGRRQKQATFVVIGTLRVKILSICHRAWYIIAVEACLYTTLTSFKMKYFVMCKVYTDVGGIKLLYHDCPPVHKIIHSLKLVNYLHIQADTQWYNYYFYRVTVFIPLRQFGSRHPLRCYSKITFK